jgi:hypothetical protein
MPGLSGEYGELGLAVAGLKRRGIKAPVVAVGDGTLGFWAAR